MDININLRAGNNHSVWDGKKTENGCSRAYKRKKRSKIKCNAHFNVHNVQFSSAWSVFYVCIYFDLAVVCPFAFIPFLSDCVLNTINEEKNIAAMKKIEHTRKACFIKPYDHWTIELNRKMGSTKYPIALSVFNTHKMTSTTRIAKAKRFSTLSQQHRNFMAHETVPIRRFLFFITFFRLRKSSMPMFISAENDEMPEKT